MGRMAASTCALVAIVTVASCRHARTRSAAEEAAIARARGTYGCHGPEVTAEETGGGGVIVHGCGERLSYTCVRTGWSVTCVPDAPVWAGGEQSFGSGRPPEESPARTLDGDEAIVVAAIADCGPIDRPAVLTVAIGIEGDVLQMDAEELPPSVRRCVTDTVQRLTFDRRGDATIREIALGPGDDTIAAAALASCTLPPDGSMRIVVDLEGRLDHVDAPDLADAVRECATASLSGARFRTGHVHTVPLSWHTAVTPTATDTTTVADAGTTASATSATSTTSTAEESARAIVEQLHDVLLACTDGAAMAVTVTWTTSGEVTLSLSGASAGTVADGCVRAAGSGARIHPPPDAAGSIRHPVH